jgi:hypothetical protein
VQIDAAREHELAAGIDLAESQPNLADRADALAIDPNVGAVLAVGRDDRPATDG